MTAKELLSHDSDHHKITVEESDGVVSLRFNGRLQSSMYGPGGLETRQLYLNLFHLAFAVNPAIKRVLVVGLGGGVLPKRLWHDYPQVSVDVAELDAQVAKIAYDYFSLPQDDRLRVVIADGRKYIADAAAPYDAIFIDAYFETWMPYDLATLEFVALCRSRLSKGGVLAYNVVGVPQGRGSRPFHRFMRGMRDTFAATYVFPVKLDRLGARQNIVVLASDELLSDSELTSRIEARVGGSVLVPGFEAFGRHLYHPRPVIGVAPLRDSDRPMDGMLHA